MSIPRFSARRAGGILLAAVIAAGIALVPAAPAAAADVTISGTVYALVDGGAPLNGAEVALRGPGFLAYDIADASGHYSITVAPGTYVLWFQAGIITPNYVSEYWNNKPSYGTATSITLISGNSYGGYNAALALGATLSGTLSTDAPVAGGSVEAHNADGVVVAYDYTDSSGHFTLVGLGTDQYYLYAEGVPGWAAEWYPNAPARRTASLLSIVAGSTSTGYNITLAPASTLTGTLKNAAGTGLAGSVVAYDAGGTGANRAAFVATETTGAGGAYSFDRLPVGTYKLVFTTAIPGTYFGTGTPLPSTGGYLNAFYNKSFTWEGANTVTLATPGASATANERLVNPFFADVTDPLSPFFSSIEWMALMNISTGTPQGAGLDPLYKPLDIVSRQSMSLFLYRLSGDSFVPPATPTFADVPTSSALYTSIEWMAHEGIAAGTASPGGLLFSPTAAVSRQSMALFLARYLGVNTTVTPTTQVFADVPVTASSAAAITWMYNSGISTGTPQPSGLPLYKPADPVSRQSMALFLYRMAHP